MARFIVSAAAEEDLREILSYLRQRSPRAAKQVKAKLRAAMTRLAEFPGIGHTRNDVDDPTLRFWTVYSFLIVYRSGQKPLEIARVLHGARNIGQFINES